MLRHEPAGGLQRADPRQRGGPSAGDFAPSFMLIRLPHHPMMSLRDCVRGMHCFFDSLLCNSMYPVAPYIPTHAVHALSRMLEQVALKS